MDLNNYTTKSKQDYSYRSTNVLNLINQVKLNQKTEKRKTIIVTVVSVLVLAISGLIITL